MFSDVFFFKSAQVRWKQHAHLLQVEPEQRYSCGDPLNSGGNKPYTCAVGFVAKTADLHVEKQFT